MNTEKYNVLILDDDYELGELLRDFLQIHIRCTVTFVTREEDFWNCLEQQPFDILFLDYMLGSTNGLEVLTRMNQRNISIPTVMMTGDGSENVAARAIQLGALDYLVKGEYSFSILPPLIMKAVRLKGLQQSMQRYLDQIRSQATLLNNMRDAVVVWDLEGKITYWNAAAERLYDCQPEQRLGQRVEEVYFPFFAPPIQFKQSISGESLPLEHCYQFSNGKSIWISSHITTLSSEGDGQPFGFMDVARDITPRKQEQEALLQSQNFIQQILDTSPNIIFILNLNDRLLSYINPEINQILGFPADEFLNQPFDHYLAQIHPDDRSTFETHLRSLKRLSEGEVVEFEYRFLNRKGGYTWLKSRDTVFSRSMDGAPVEAIGVIQDITASKLAEQKLQQRLKSEKILSGISNKFLNTGRHDTDHSIRDAILQVIQFVEISFGMVFLLEENHLAPLHLYQAQQGLKQHYYFPVTDLSQIEIPWLLDQLNQPGPVIIKSKADLPEQALAERCLIDQIGMESVVFIPMVYNRGLFGIIIFGTTQASYPWNEDSLYMLQTFGEMVTNSIIQRQVDQALRKSEARYRAIVEEHQTEMICRFLKDATLTFVNESYCKYYSKDRRQLTGTSFLNPITEEDREPVRNLLANLSTAQPVNIFEHRVCLRGGEIRWQEWTSRAIFDQHNDFIEFQAVGRDITERKNMEAQLKNAQTHLMQSARLASIGELASGVAHQISNPLTTIIADAQILLQQLDRRHPGRESAEAIYQAGWRAQQVIDELMKFSQPLQNTYEPVSINNTINKALLLTSAHLQASGIQLTVDLEPDLPSVTGNARQLTDLWLNLLLLARSAFDDGRRHTIRVRTRGKTDKVVRVEISDDGKPIPFEQFDTIFEPQLVPTGSGRGTGMELSLCREIVRQNRGEISILGNPNETTFRIIFSKEGQPEWNQPISS